MDQVIPKPIPEHDALLLLPVELANHLRKDVLLNRLLNLQLKMLIAVIVEFKDHILSHEGRKFFLVLDLVYLVDLSTAVLAKNVLLPFVDDQPKDLDLWRLRLNVNTDPELRQIIF